MTNIMDGSQIDEAVRMLRASIAVGVDIQKTLELFDEKYRDVIFNRYALESQGVSRAEPTILHNKGRRSWSYKSSDGVAWRKLKQYLIDQLGRKEHEVDALDVATDKILEQLADPSEEGDGLEPVKGLVIGYVQSGKTANYTALAAKAFDSGYKIVIVLSGIHRALRRQTQIRMNDELGIPGLGKPRPSAKSFGPTSIEPITAMTSEDLQSGDSQYSGVSKHVLQGKVLFVIKKNTAVLERLLSWLGEAENVDYPTLIIDDESDQASINTGGNRDEIEENPDQDNPDEPAEAPAVINSKVRRLVNQFRNVSYVGYTATPYANVFIDHQATDRIAGEDLYPKDFIVSLPKPPGYFGPEELFEESFSSDPDGNIVGLEHTIIQIVPDTEVALLNELLEHESVGDFNQETLPEGLRQATRLFILGTSALCTIKTQDIPTAFLVHTTQSKLKQNNLSEIIEKYVRLLQREWRYDNELSRTLWEKEWESYSSTFGTSEYPTLFSEIETELDRLLSRFGEITVLTLNSDSADELDYQYQPFGASIVIGGNKLSRGLTIEGLIVSYFTRKAADPKADTLTQMGRFFGHRKPTMAISRIFTTYELKCAFQEIALVESALRRDILRYQKEGLKPIDFGPRVLKRANLMPTARNRMGAASNIGRTYSGELVQTTSFPDDSKPLEYQGKNISRLEKNLRITKDLFEKLGDPHQADEGEVQSRAIWAGVESSQVVNYLQQYSGVEDATRFVPSHLSAYIDDLNKAVGHPELTLWTLAVLGRKPLESLGTETFGTSAAIGRISRALDLGSSSSIGTLVTPLSIRDMANGPVVRGDELIDLDTMEVLEAYSSGMPLDEFRQLVRGIRSKEEGLLIIYPISPDSIGSTNGKNCENTIGSVLFRSSVPSTIIGIAVVFPNSDCEITEFWQGSAGKNDEH